MMMDPAAKQKVIYITYLIAALEITWMFLQFSITPVRLLFPLFIYDQMLNKLNHQSVWTLSKGSVSVKMPALSVFMTFQYFD